MTFKDEHAASSKLLTKANTLLKSLTVLDDLGNYPFRGIALDLVGSRQPLDNKLQLVGAGHWFQFTRKVIDYSCIHGFSHEYAEFEHENPDKAQTTDNTFTGLVNTVGTGGDNSKISDTSKTGDSAWVLNAYADDKYGVIIRKNPSRPADAFAKNGDTASGYTGGTDYTLTRSNGANCIWANNFTAPVEGVDFVFTYHTCIDRDNVSKATVRISFNTVFASAVVGPIDPEWRLYAYDYTIPAYVEIDHGATPGTYYRAIEVDPAKYISDAGAPNEMKVKFHGGDSGGVGVRWSAISVFFTRCDLVYSSIPSLQYDITSNTIDGTLDLNHDINDHIDSLDYYTIGLRVDEVLKALITDNDDLAWGQALTVTSIAAGTKYLDNNWALKQVSQLINYCIEVGGYDAFIEDDLDVMAQISSSATVSGLRFDETTGYLQWGGSRGQILGSQLFNRVKVQWLSGIETCDVAASQAIYGVVEAPAIIDKSILSAETARYLGDAFLAKKDAPMELLIKSSAYIYLPFGQSVIVNFPSRNITETAYVISGLKWHWTNNQFSDMEITLILAGSPTHRYKTDIESFIELQERVKDAHQLLNTQGVTSAVNTSTTLHAALHAPGARDELLRDEDDMASDDAEKGASQQSIKAYADGKVSDAAYAAGWDGVTTIAPSKNAVYDKIETLLGLDKQFDIAKIIDGATSYTNRLQFGDGTAHLGFWVSSAVLHGYICLRATKYMDFWHNMYYDGGWSQNAAYTALRLAFYNDTVNDTNYFLFIGKNKAGTDSKYLQLFPKSTGIFLVSDSNINLNPTGSTLFTGNVDLATGNAPFLPRRVSHADQPVPASGELLIWYHTDDAKTYLVYTDPVGGARKVELA